MKHMLATTADNPISFDDQDAHTGESSHDFILIETKNRIQNSPAKIRNFCEGVRNLKQERVDADYRLKQFTLDESIQCKDDASRLISNLKTYFGNI